MNFNERFYCKLDLSCVPVQMCICRLHIISTTCTLLPPRKPFSIIYSHCLKICQLHPCSFSLSCDLSSCIEWVIVHWISIHLSCHSTVLLSYQCWYQVFPPLFHVFRVNLEDVRISNDWVDFFPRAWINHVCAIWFGNVYRPFQYTWLMSRHPCNGYG